MEVMNWMHDSYFPLHEQQNRKKDDVVKGPALIAVCSTALLPTARCLSQLRDFPDGRVVWGVATDW